jgi:hypothetical protein
MKKPSILKVRKIPDVVDVHIGTGSFSGLPQSPVTSDEVLIRFIGFSIRDEEPALVGGTACLKGYPRGPARRTEPSARVRAPLRNLPRTVPRLEQIHASTLSGKLNPHDGVH